MPVIVVPKTLQEIGAAITAIPLDVFSESCGRASSLSSMHLLAAEEVQRQRERFRQGGPPPATSYLFASAFLFMPLNKRLLDAREIGKRLSEIRAIIRAVCPRSLALPMLAGEDTPYLTREAFLERCEIELGQLRVPVYISDKKEEEDELANNR